MTLETKIPPLVVAILVGGSTWLAGQVSPSFDMTLPFRSVIAVALLVAAAAMAAASVSAFRRAGTTLNPIRPDETTVFVAHGVFRYTRNPMYLAMQIALLAWALWIANGVALLVSVSFTPYITYLQIVPEERSLEARFGVDYTAYRQRVRRWI